jgi:hypothetical protein
MANRYVRIYQKPEGHGEPATIIGFSYSAVPDQEGLEDFQSYFKNHAQTIRELGATAREISDKEMLEELNGVSAYYLEIQPPLQDEQLSALGQLCTQHVYTGNNYGFLIDNRATKSPFEPFDLRGDLLAKWIA